MKYNIKNMIEYLLAIVLFSLILYLVIPMLNDCKLCREATIQSIECQKTHQLNCNLLKNVVNQTCECNTDK